MTLFINYLVILLEKSQLLKMTLPPSLTSGPKETQSLESPYTRCDTARMKLFCGQ